MQITPICVVCADSGNTREAARNGGYARLSVLGLITARGQPTLMTAYIKVVHPQHPLADPR
jgi:hypothetical protein